MRVLVTFVLLCGVAHADPLRVPGDGDNTPDAFALEAPVDFVSNLDREAVFERAGMFERAIVATSHARARANLMLELADLWVGYALYEDARFADTHDIDQHIAAEVALDRAKVHYNQLVRSPELSGWPNLERVFVHYTFVLRRKHEPTNVPLQRLVDEFPASRHLPYAHLALGDDALRRTDAAAALAHYTKAAFVEFPERAHALYKQARVELFEMNRPSVAFALLERALAAPGHERLTAELEHAVVAAFVRLDRPANAFETFTRMSPDRAIEMLDEAAKLWHRLGKYPQALAARRELLRRTPYDPRACDWEAAVARLSNNTDDRLQYLAAVERLVQRSQRTHDERCEEAAVDLSFTTAHILAGDARAARSRDDLILAGRLYDLFLRAFPDHPRAATARAERKRIFAPPRRRPPIN